MTADGGDFLETARGHPVSGAENPVSDLRPGIAPGDVATAWDAAIGSGRAPRTCERSMGWRGTIPD